MRRCRIILVGDLRPGCGSGLHPGCTADLFEEVRRVPWLGPADGRSAGRYGIRIAESHRAGNASNSTLIQRVTSTKPGFKMPPVGEPLSSTEIATIRDWIDGGAKAPVEKAAAAPRSSHWSFQPIKRAAVPDSAEARMGAESD